MSSFLDELRALDEQLRHNVQPLELLVPGSGGKFAVRYRPPADRDALTPVLAALASGGALAEAQELQLIVDCCDEILVRNDDPESDSVGELESAEGGPLRFDAGDERWDGEKTARGCVRRLFNAARFPLAPSRHVGSLIDYLQGTDAEIASRVEGKSGGPVAS